MRKIIFEVETKPIPKARPRFYKTGKRVITYTPKKTQNFEKIIKNAFISHVGNIEPFTNKCKINIDFYTKIPKSITKKNLDILIKNNYINTKRPDLDNLIKAVLDSLNKIAYVDDNIIYKIESRKLYSDKDHIVIELEGE